MYSKILKPEYVFVVLGLLAGLLFVFLVPPFQSPDEPVQFGKAVAISQGQFLSVKKDGVSGNYLPKSLEDFELFYRGMCFGLTEKTSFKKIVESRNITLEEGNKVFTDLKYHSMYSPLAFLPQSAGVFIAKFFTDSVYWIMICAKLSLLLFYLIFGYYSIKSMPFAKNLALLVLLMPMSLFLGASGSADGVLISVSIFFVAKIFQYCFQKKIITDKQYAILFACAIALSLIKQSFLLSLFVLFIPKEKFGVKANIKLTALLLTSLLVSVLWSKFAYSVFVPMNGANPEKQIQFIIQNPIIYLKLFLDNILKQFYLILYSFIGVLGWMNVRLFPYPFVYYLYLFLFAGNIFLKSDEDINNVAFLNWQKFFILLWGILNFVFICTTVYVSWVKPYYIGLFYGLQGRYFIPIALPFLLLLYFTDTKVFKVIHFKYLTLLNALFLIFVYICVFLTVYIRYYVIF